MDKSYNVVFTCYGDNTLIAVYLFTWMEFSEFILQVIFARTGFISWFYVILN